MSNVIPQNFIKHEVENEGDWSEWVNPNSEQYFMKCCDCGLVHEMQFKVAKYSEGDECEFVEDANLQAVFRARRTTPPAAVVQDLPFGVSGGLVAIKTLLSRDPCVHANTAIEMIDAILKEHPAAQRQWVGLTDESVVSAAARVLSDRVAASCNVDCGDMWMLHGNDSIEDARAMLEAAEAKLKEKNT